MDKNTSTALEVIEKTRIIDILYWILVISSIGAIIGAIIVGAMNVNTHNGSKSVSTEVRELELRNAYKTGFYAGNLTRASKPITNGVFNLEMISDEEKMAWENYSNHPFQSRVYTIKKN